MRRRLNDFFCTQDDPINLAMFRIVVFIALLWAATQIDVRHFARMPAGLRAAPPGYTAWFDFIPFAERSLSVARMVLVLACAAGLIGLWTRSAALIACAAATYVLGVPNFFGKVDHIHHHLIWFSALLAVSDAGDVWSIDALRAHNGPPEPSVRYALPIRFAWLLIGVAYFFAGLAKLFAGPEWVFSDNIRNLLYLFWSEKGFVPLLRIDRYPFLCRAAALLTIVFEVGFLPALFFPRRRPLLVAGGLLFHALNFIYLRIKFTSLTFCYLIFIDWAGLWRRLCGYRGSPRRIPDHRDEGESHRPYAVVAVGTILLMSNALCGALAIYSWPFSAYPRFAGIQSEPQRVAIELEVDSADGSYRSVGIPTNLRALQSLLALPEGEQRQRGLQALRDPFIAAAGGLAPGETLRLYEVRRSTIPEEGGRRLGNPKVLLEFKSK